MTMVSLSGEEKSAILLKSLAPEVTEKILDRLGPDRGARLRVLMSKIQDGPQSQKILADLLNEVRQVAGAPGRTIDLVASSETSPPLRIAPETSAEPATTTKQSSPASSKAAESKSSGLSPFPAIPEGLDPIKALSLLPSDRLGLVLEAETARTVSIILNFLDGDKAGEVFRRLPEGLRAEVSVQFSTQGMPNLEVLRRIADAIIQKCRKLVEKPLFPEGAARLRKMADMLRGLDRGQRLQVLNAMEEKAPEQVAQIKAMMYRFEDVQRLDNRSMQKILKEVDTKNLAVALRGAEPDIRDRFLNNLSKRAQENLAEEIELARSAPRNEVEQAQNAIAQIIQRLDLAGELVMTE